MLIKDINFFDRYKESQRREKSLSKQTVIRIMICVGIAIIMFIASSSIGVYTLTLQQEIERINTYIQSPEVQENLDVLAAKQQVFDNITQYCQNIESATSKINTKVRLNQKIIKEIMAQKPGNLKINTFSFSEGIINIGCDTTSEPEITTFVHRLTSVPFIHKVTYGGFTQLAEVASTSITIEINEGGLGHALYE